MEPDRPAMRLYFGRNRSDPAVSRAREQIKTSEFRVILITISGISWETPHGGRSSQAGNESAEPGVQDLGGLASLGAFRSDPEPAIAT
jgi:hypothetical protein